MKLLFAISTKAALKNWSSFIANSFLSQGYGLDRDLITDRTEWTRDFMDQRVLAINTNVALSTDGLMTYGLIVHVIVAVCDPFKHPALIPARRLKTPATAPDCLVMRRHSSHITNQKFSLYALLHNRYLSRTWERVRVLIVRITIYGT